MRVLEYNQIEGYLMTISDGRRFEKGRGTHIIKRERERERERERMESRHEI